MIGIPFPSEAVAALTTVMATVRVPNDRRGTFKRIQAEVVKVYDGTVCRAGEFSLDTADWEWLDLAVKGTADWPGQIVLLDGDDKLRECVQRALAPENGDGKA